MLRRRDEIVATLRPYLDASLRQAMKKGFKEELTREELRSLAKSLPAMAKHGVMSRDVFDKMRDSARLVDVRIEDIVDDVPTRSHAGLYIGVGLALTAAVSALVYFVID